MRVCGVDVNEVELAGRPAAKRHQGYDGDALAPFSPEKPEPSTICAIDPGACPQMDEERLRSRSVAVFGLSRTGNGYWMVTGEGLFHVQGGQKQEVDWPILEEQGHTALGWTPGAMVVVTDANWAASLSGYTPLVAATSLAGPVGVDDLARYPSLQSLAGGEAHGTCWIEARMDENDIDHSGRGLPRAVCLDEDRVLIKTAGEWESVPVRWRRDAGMAWIAEIDEQKSVRFLLGRKYAAVSRGTGMNRIRLRRAEGDELAGLRTEISKFSKVEKAPRSEKAAGD